jgi:glycosyltransferase involved in cell wall biosynthesis
MREMIEERGLEIKPAVLHLQIELNITCGVTRSIRRIISNSHNYEHFVIALGGNAVDRFKGTNCLIINADRSSIIGSFEILFTIVRFIKKHKITVVNSHHRYFDLMSTFIKFLTGVKTITTVHSKVYDKKIFSYKADHLIAVSNGIKGHIINNFKMAPEKISVIYNFIDPREVRITVPHALLRKNLKIPEDNVILGYFGRLDINEKGVDLLIKAIEMVIKDFNNVCFILGGDGVDEPILRETVNKLKIPVIFLGAVENIWDYVFLSDIIILASRIDPFPLIMIEAGLASKAFIGSDVDGIPEFIDNYSDGILFSKEDVTELCSKMKELILNKNLRIKLGENLHQKVLSNFVPGKIIPRLEEIYRIACSKC